MENKARGISSRMKEIKSLSMHLEIKRMSEAGVFAGYASVFNVVDSQRDKVLPGAFAESLAASGSEVKLLWQHRLDEPIGVITSLFEDARGLYIEGRLLLDVSQAREAYTLLKAGVVTGLSIGYSPRRFTRDPDSGVRLLQAIDLIEVSLVTLPANDKAQVTVVKEVQLQDINYASQQKNTPQMLACAEMLDRAITILRQQQ